MPLQQRWQHGQSHQSRRDSLDELGSAPRDGSRLASRQPRSRLERISKTSRQGRGQRASPGCRGQEPKETVLHPTHGRFPPGGEGARLEAATAGATAVNLALLPQHARGGAIHTASAGRRPSFYIGAGYARRRVRCTKRPSWGRLKCKMGCE